jgi:hypothetical protein
MSDNGNDAAVPGFRPLTVEGSLEDLERGMVAMSLNEPELTADGTCVVKGPLMIRGWAHARAGIESVVAIIDGRRYEALRPITRTDLLEYYGADAAAEAGFVLQLHPSECPPGPHRIAIVATGHDGDVVGVEGDVECRPDNLDAEAEPDSVAIVDWIEERRIPGLAPDPVVDGDPAEELERLRGIARMWESRARLAEADAAASRVEAGLANNQQEAAIKELQETRAKLSEFESKLES